MTNSAGGASRPRTETTDRYLETIYYIEHEGETVRPGRLAEWLGVSAPTVSVSLQRLARDGWLSILPDRSVTLTNAGEEVASTIVRRHRIVERWLTDVLGLDWATADAEAAGLAHGVSDVVLDRLDALLNRPATCPHGNVIPGRRPPQGRPLMRLDAVVQGATVAVARVSEVAEHDAPQLLSLLDAGGIAPGIALRIQSRTNDALDVTVGDRLVTLPGQVAHSVWVEQPN